MTTTEWAYNRTRELMQQYGIQGWMVGFDNARRRAGQTNHRDRIVTLSKHFVAANSPERIELTIRHELAHVLVGPGHGHDAVWRAKAKELGHSGQRQYNAAETVMPTPPWSGSCDCGSGIHQRHRMTKLARTGVCNGCRKTVTWVRPGIS